MYQKFDQNITEGILFTDQYQLTMMQLYYKLGLHNTVVQFDHFFRQYPDYGNHRAGYCINAGLEWLVDWILHTKVTKKDIELLRTQKNKHAKPIFEQDFLHWLQNDFSLDSLTIAAIPEGRVIHANVSLTVVQGPIAVAQYLETILLNQLNYQILIATKSSRLKLICPGQILLEFGARRAQSNGAVAGTRAALIGGADFSSNVGISHLLGLEPKGTHAHSMIQLFLSLGMSELDAFYAFADIYPDNCILLVDTINTLESGIPNAIKVFEKLKQKGFIPSGIRIDSGDLAYLTVQAVHMLNKAGFPEVKVFLTNELDELSLWQIISQIKEEAQKFELDPDQIIERLSIGVGTKLITSSGSPSLGGVYKLVARLEKEHWIPSIKISENREKIPNPGNKNVWRIYNNQDKAIADLLSLKDENISQEKDITLQHPLDQTRRRLIKKTSVSSVESLLVTIVDNGKLDYTFPTLAEIREIRDQDLERLDTGVKRLINPHIYHVSLTPKLSQLKHEMIQSIRYNEK
jgi:nicotinate phosphoribosyltransferase